MSKRPPPLYQRGKYWLEWDERADGFRRSPHLTIFWYDPATGRVRSASTGTADQQLAIRVLDRRYLADLGEAPAFCPECGRPRADDNAYLLLDAIADYRLEWGDQQISADSIVARLDHVVRYLEAEEARGAEARFGLATSCAAAASTVFIEAFRAWSRAEPVTWRNAEGVVTVSRPRSPATTEESVGQLAAAINHAVDADPPRASKRPAWRPLARKQVSRPRRTRLSVEEIAKIVGYAAEPDKRRESLHAFVVASICTIARPDAIVDLNVRPDRGQWWPGAPTIDLNPMGRLQTKKFRPILPVLPPLQALLAAEYQRWTKLDAEARRHGGWLVNYHGRPINDVRRAWRTMRDNLDFPHGREWMPYVLRHSLATLVRNAGASKWDLEGYLGHRGQSQTEVYAIGEFATVQAALTAILAEIESLVPGALHRSGTGAGHPNIEPKEVKMPG